MPRAGKYRNRIQLQSLSDLGQSETGEPQRGWTTIATLWGEIMPMTGREPEFGDQVVARSTHRITLRYREDVTTQMRALHRGRAYNFQAVVNPELRDVELVIAAEVQDGP